MKSYHNRAIDLRVEGMGDAKPMKDRIFVRPIKEEGGIIDRVESYHNKPMKGEVVAVGDGTVTKKGVKVPIDLEIGDVILFGPNATTEIVLRDEKLLITREENVFGVI